MYNQHITKQFLSNLSFKRDLLHTKHTQVARAYNYILTKCHQLRNAASNANSVLHWITGK